MADAAEPGAPTRRHYSDEERQLVRLRYPNCETPEDKQALADELGIGVAQLYHLASRLGVSRPYTERSPDEEAAYAMPGTDSRLWRIRDDWRRRNTLFLADDDAYLRAKYGQQPLEEIAYVLGHSEIATARRARQLGLRQFARMWQLERVCGWLNLTPAQLLRFGVDAGLTIWECCDRRGKVRIRLVETEALAQMLAQDQLWVRLTQADHGADRFFVDEVLAGAIVARRGRAAWVANRWISHGDTCLHPFAANFGRLYGVRDDRQFGANDHPRTLTFDALRELIR